MAKDAWYNTVSCIEMVLFPSCNYFSSLHVVNIFSITVFVFVFVDILEVKVN